MQSLRADGRFKFSVCLESNRAVGHRHAPQVTYIVAVGCSESVRAAAWVTAVSEQIFHAHHVPAMPIKCDMHGGS